MLSGRTIVITGAARGVGLALAEACAAQGARLVLGDILEPQSREAAVRLAAAGAQARFVKVDLADPASIEAFADDIRRHEAELVAPDPLITIRKDRRHA